MKVRKGVKSAVELKGAPSKHQQPSAHRAYLLNVPAGQEIIVSIADVADLAEMQLATVQVAAAPWPPVTEHTNEEAVTLMCCQHAALPDDLISTVGAP